MNPLALPIWLAGLGFYFFSRVAKSFRALGWARALTAAFIVSVARVSNLVRGRQRHVGIVAVPAAVPLAEARVSGPPDRDLHTVYEGAASRPAPSETHQLGPLPQVLAGQFAWEEMAAAVARVYNNLPPEVRSKTAIFGQNCGQAEAIDLFGPKYALPPAISGHQSYFLWGPRGYTGESVIVMAGRQQDLESRFSVYHPYSMPYEHFDVFYCRGLKQPLNEIWPQVKN